MPLWSKRNEAKRYTGVVVSAVVLPRWSRRVYAMWRGALISMGRKWGSVNRLLSAAGRRHSRMELLDVGIIGQSHNAPVPYPTMHHFGTETCILLFRPAEIIDQSHNAPAPYPTMHHFGTEMWTFLFQSGVLWDMGQVHCGIFPFPTMQHFGREMCAFLFQSGVLWNMGQVHCGIY